MNELKEVLLISDRLREIARRYPLTDDEAAAIGQSIILMRRWQITKLRHVAVDMGYAVTTAPNRG